MQNLKNQPSTSNLPETENSLPLAEQTNGHETVPEMEILSGVVMVPGSAQTEAEEQAVNVYPVRPAPQTKTTSARGRSLRMQYRFLQILRFSFWLFARLIFWFVIVDRLRGAAYTERTSTPRLTRYAREFRRFAIKMGGVMIKLGQFISTRVDMLPDEVIKELASLQDEVPNVSLEKIREVIESELGPIPQRFEWFDEKPVAAASLGQVHRARLGNGDRVVVKVKRPGIDEICYTDLDALEIVAKVAMRFRFISRRADAVALSREFGRVLLEELSYVHEAQNARRFAEMFKNDLGVYIPAVYTELSTDTVITLEDVTSIKVTDFAALEAAGVSRNAVARRLMDAYLKMVFEHRFFHADPHPGNLFVYPLPQQNSNGAQPNPTQTNTTQNEGRPFYLIFIDFGMTGSLTPNLVKGLINTLSAVINRDAKKLVQSYNELGFILPGADLHRLEQATLAVFDQVWGLDMAQLTNVGYNDMMQLGREFSDLLYDMPFQVPQDFLYLGRTLGILSGMGTSLDPNFNPWHELQPFTQKLVVQTLKESGETGGILGLPMLQNLFNGTGAKTLVNIGQAIFNRTTPSDAVLARLERGDLHVQADMTPRFEKQLVRVETQSRKTTRAVLTGSLLIAATLLYTNGDIAPAVIGYVLSGLGFLATLFAGSSE